MSVANVLKSLKSLNSISGPDNLDSEEDWIERGNQELDSLYYSGQSPNSHVFNYMLSKGFVAVDYLPIETPTFINNLDPSPDFALIWVNDREQYSDDIQFLTNAVWTVYLVDTARTYVDSLGVKHWHYYYIRTDVIKTGHLNLWIFDDCLSSSTVSDLVYKHRYPENCTFTEVPEKGSPDRKDVNYLAHSPDWPDLADEESRTYGEVVEELKDVLLDCYSRG